MAASDPPHGEPGAAKHPEALEGLRGVRGAGGSESAVAAEHGAYQFLVGAYEPDEWSGEHAPWLPGCRHALSLPARSHSTNVENFTCRTPGDAITTTSVPPSISTDRTACLMRRFTRFRSTADPTRLPTTRPTRTSSSTPGAVITTRPPDLRRVPVRITRSKSVARRSERTAVKLRDASVPWRGGSSRRRVRHGCAYAPGIRDDAYDVGLWVDRYVSWDHRVGKTDTGYEGPFRIVKAPESARNAPDVAKKRDGVGCRPRRSDLVALHPSDQALRRGEGFRSRRQRRIPRS